MTGAEDTTSDAAAWRQYWSQAGGRDAVSAGEAGDALTAVWRRELAQLKRVPDRVADLACGLGPAARAVREVLGARPLLMTCDIALEGAKRAGAAVGGAPVVADGLRLPFAPDALDLVVSQFGVEYAGPGAFAETGRVLRADGGAIVIAHLKGGAIDAESWENLQVLSALEEAGVLAATREAVSSGRARDLVGENRIQPVAEVANSKPGAAASRYVAATVPDLVRLAANPNAFAQSEAFAYIEAQEASLGAYQTRMASMRRAALDRDGADAALIAMSADKEDRRLETLSGPKGDYAWLMLVGTAASEGRRPGE